MSTRTRITVVAIAIAVCLGAGASLAPVAAQSSPVVTFGADSVTADDTASISLVATDIPSEGVGAYNVTVVHDADTVDLTVEGTDRFQTTTSTNGSSGTVATTIVGYTGESSGEGGDVTLATLSIEATEDGDSTVSVGEITTLADPDGNELGGSVGDAVSVSAAADESDEAGDDGGDGGGGGGGAPPAQEQDEPTTVTGVTSATEGGESASGTITLGIAGETIRFESDTTSEGGDVTVERLDIELAETVTNVDVAVTTTNTPPAGAPDVDTDQTGEPMGYVETTVEGADDAAIARSEFAFTVSQDSLDRTDTDPEDVRLYRIEDGTPVGLPTEHLGDNRFTASTDGFSVFVVGTTPADISIASGQLDSSSVGIEEPFTTTVELQNAGGRAGEITLNLEADGDVLTSETVSVSESADTAVDLSANIDQAGTYEITVNGNAVGTLEVTATPTPTATETAGASPTPDASAEADDEQAATDGAATGTASSPDGDSTGGLLGGFGAAGLLGIVAVLVVTVAALLVLRRRTS